MPQAVSLKQARRYSEWRGSTSADESRGKLRTVIEELRCQLQAADQRLITAAAELRAEQRERIEWERIAAGRAERIVRLEHMLAASVDVCAS